jgi:hypothetical protein
MTPRSAGARASARATGDQHEQATASLAGDRTRCERAARRPEWVSPLRAQFEAELRGLVAMLADEDVDVLVDLGIDLWLEPSRRCRGERDPRSDG